MSQWRKLVREHLVQRQTAGYANGTLEASARWLKRFMAWCERRGLDAPTQVTAADVEAFGQELARTPGRRCAAYSPGSIEQALGVLRALFAWAARREHLLFNPMRDLVVPHVPQRLPPQLTIEDVKRLLDAADDGTLLGLRDHAVLETFYGTGIRRLELRELQVSDVDLRGRKLRVLGKGRYERMAPIGDRLAGVLERYLKECRPRLAAAHETALFVSQYGTRYGSESLTQMVNRVARRAGLLRVTPHMLRHAFAVHLLECGADFFEVQHLLGHRRPGSTEIYTHVATAAFTRKFRNCHPRGRQLTHPTPEGDET